MNFNIKEIENALLISYTNSEGKYCERAFTKDVSTYAEDAKAFVTEKKPIMADHAEKQAHNRINQLTSTEEAQP